MGYWSSEGLGLGVKGLDVYGLRAQGLVDMRLGVNGLVIYKRLRVMDYMLTV